jgi:ribosome-associated protein YbcJ (S4-like RNA binding protein)
VIQGGEVRVNGQPETRRKRKLRAGDVVDFDGRSQTVGPITVADSADSADSDD